MDVRLLQGDCLERLGEVQDASVDMVFADLPYGVTANKWDTPIRLDVLWAHLLRVGNLRCAFAFTATQPFATTLICSQRNLFRYDLIWEKTKATGFVHANKMPLRCHESVLVFYRHRPAYSPQKIQGEPYNKGIARANAGGVNLNKGMLAHLNCNVSGERHPRSVLRDIKNINENRRFHPTEKPVALLEWLIKTYTNPGDTVLDPVMGSGTTGVACRNTGRSFIGIEKDPDYFAIAEARIATPAPPQQTQLSLKSLGSGSVNNVGSRL